MDVMKVANVAVGKRCTLPSVSSWVAMFSACIKDNKKQPSFILSVTNVCVASVKMEFPS